MVIITVKHTDDPLLRPPLSLSTLIKITSLIDHPVCNLTYCTCTYPCDRRGHLTLVTGEVTLPLWRERSPYPCGGRGHLTLIAGEVTNPCGGRGHLTLVTGEVTYPCGGRGHLPF